jgi:hypothetical protein
MKVETEKRKDTLRMRLPQRVEDVRVVVVCHGRREDERRRAEGEEDFAQHRVRLFLGVYRRLFPLLTA